MKHILYAIAGTLLLGGCGKEAAPVPPPVYPEAGKSIAQAECAGCHRMDGSGKTAKIPNLAGQPADYLVEAMHAYREGRRHHAALAVALHANLGELGALPVVRIAQGPGRRGGNRRQAGERRGDVL